jgi:GTP-binding protein HflX
VLEELGVGESTPLFEAWNKLDLLDPERRDALATEVERRDDVMAISALTGEGVDDLIEQIAAKLTAGHRRYCIELDPADGAGAAWLHAHGEVLGQSDEDGRSFYDVRLAPADHDRFMQRQTAT